MPLCGTSGSCCKEIKKTDVMNDGDLRLLEKRAVLSHHEQNFNQHITVAHSPSSTLHSYIIVHILVPQIKP